MLDYNHAAGTAQHINALIDTALAAANAARPSRIGIRVC